MSATFSLDDDSVVVIIGSGAGGGTLADELTKKGVNVVILEAGKHFTRADFENDEWAMFKKISWLDKRISAGGWHHTDTYPNLPAWIVKGVGGSTMHFSGLALRFLPHDFETRSVYGEVKGANVLDWPISYDELAPYFEGPAAGLTWVYFLAPWGLQLELVSAPEGMAYEQGLEHGLWDPRMPEM
ncbi:NAD(P)-binding protein [Oceanimonas baumannii]|uniref:NAD(P)-binding protein n=1 Tax=Oceanimonas baumannii TaxID=129578 RepID=A0ABY2EUJ1_9GAMM|nr:NAD(P)-binding protein [Oceanimonas baumannii]TDW55263.1 putative NAD(P)-binding protein [Oceanimonas baumannii]